MKLWTLGIDPGRTTGLALLSPQRELRAIDSANWKKLGGAENVIRHCRYFARLYSGIHPDELSKRLWIAIEVPHPGIAYMRSKGSPKRTFNAGQVYEKATALRDLFLRAGFTVTTNQPKAGWTKWDAHRFEGFFRTNLKSNGHERDAACIAYIGQGKLWEETEIEKHKQGGPGA